MIKKVIITSLFVLGTSIPFFSCASSPEPTPSSTSQNTTVERPRSSGPAILEGFERSFQWYPVKGTWNDGDQSLDAKISTSNVSEGAKTMELVFDFKDTTKGATVYTENMSISNWTGVKTVVTDFYNPLGTPLKVSLGICSGGNWDWQETAQIELAPGENLGIRFNLLDGSLKSAATSWVHNSNLLYTDDIKRVVFKFMSDKVTQGSVFVDNIRIVK